MMGRMLLTRESVSYGAGMSVSGATGAASDAVSGGGLGITGWLFIEQIKAYRLRSGLTQTDMAGVGLGSSARWNRLENHKPGVRIRAGDVLVMARAFGLSPSEATELEDLRDRAEREGDRGVPNVGPTFREYLAFERHAYQVDSLGGVHGLIQTPQFAAATAALDDVEESQIPTVVALRQERQRLTLGRARVRVVLDEDVLNRIVESPAAMDDLKRHMLQLTKDGTADIRVHPESLGAYSPLKTSSTILRFTIGTTNRAIVYTESLIGGSHTDRADLVAKVDRKFTTVFNESTPLEEHL